VRTRRLLTDILADRARSTPDKRAYVFRSEDDVEQDTLTYRDLHERALAVAGELARHCRPGDRALLLFPPGLDFIVSYFGCLYARVIAVPVNRPRRNRVQDATLGIIKDADPAVLLTVSSMRVMLEMTRIDVDLLPSTAGFQPPAIEHDEVAFLQYTSGSTSAPKGVRVTHRNLLANQEMITRAFGHDENSTVVGWAPLFHDQGLIGNVLNPLYVGSTSILMSPLVFIRWPLRWLTTISHYRAHTSGGPNFAYEACLARAARDGVPDVDLSCWRNAFNGAEPIRAETLRRFADVFAPAGFRPEAHFPCYGLAEATLMVSASGTGRGARTVVSDAGRTLVGSGSVADGQDVRIVDPSSGYDCAPGEVGEIRVAGENVTKGYWRRPESFDPYLRTGDLGMLVDGELYVVGRLKDLIIIRGRNFYPQDIEQTVESAHPALQEGACAAFSVPGAAGEKLIVAPELKREHLGEVDRSDVTATIRAAVAREHDVSVGDVVLLGPVQLQKTSSGKIMRSAARDRYLKGELGGTD
jgi:acyl-CoA synthetase (AMP-forming)/AMP-acid ligase II